VSYTLVRMAPAVRLLDVQAFAAASGLHPEMVHRLVALGLLEPVRDPTGDLWFPPAQLVAAARIQRLRAGFSLNYAALGLVIELLDRVAALESQLRAARRGDQARSTRIGG
jgi:chaperone modulatory protein CbpM